MLESVKNVHYFKSSKIIRATKCSTLYTLVTATAAKVHLYNLCPLYRMLYAEYFRDNGKHALIIYDDFLSMPLPIVIKFTTSSSTWTWSFPGDVFYAHSRLLERAAS